MYTTKIQEMLSTSGTINAENYSENSKNSASRIHSDAFPKSKQL